MTSRKVATVDPRIMVAKQQCPSFIRETYWCRSEMNEAEIRQYLKIIKNKTQFALELGLVRRCNNNTLIKAVQGMTSHQYWDHTDTFINRGGDYVFVISPYKSCGACELGPEWKPYSPIYNLGADTFYRIIKRGEKNEVVKDYKRQELAKSVLPQYPSFTSRFILDKKGTVPCSDVENAMPLLHEMSRLDRWLKKFDVLPIAQRIDEQWVWFYQGLSFCPDTLTSTLDNLEKDATVAT
jgi:hypothetical protein